jgi:hypothetical protein
LHQVTLAHAGLADQDDVNVSANEIAGGELFVRDAFDRLVEGPVEGVERLVLGKLGGGDAALDGAVAAPGGLFAEQPVDGFQGGEPLPFGDVEDVVELLGDDRDAEDRQVVEDPVT